MDKTGPVLNMKKVKNRSLIISVPEQSKITQPIKTTVAKNVKKNLNNFKDLNMKIKLDLTRNSKSPLLIKNLEDKQKVPLTQREKIDSKERLITNLNRNRENHTQRNSKKSIDLKPNAKSKKSLNENILDQKKENSAYYIQNRQINYSPDKKTNLNKYTHLSKFKNNSLCFKQIESFKNSLFSEIVSSKQPEVKSNIVQEIKEENKFLQKKDNKIDMAKSNEKQFSTSFLKKIMKKSTEKNILNTNLVEKCDFLKNEEELDLLYLRETKSKVISNTNLPFVKKIKINESLLKEKEKIKNISLDSNLISNNYSNQDKLDKIRNQLNRKNSSDYKRTVSTENNEGKKTSVSGKDETIKTNSTSRSKEIDSIEELHFNFVRLLQTSKNLMKNQDKTDNLRLNKNFSKNYSICPIDESEFD